MFSFQTHIKPFDKVYWFFEIYIHSFISYHEAEKVLQFLATLSPGDVAQVSRSLEFKSRFANLCNKVTFVPYYFSLFNAKSQKRLFYI